MSCRVEKPSSSRKASQFHGMGVRGLLTSGLDGDPHLTVGIHLTAKEWSMHPKTSQEIYTKLSAWREV